MFKDKNEELRRLEALLQEEESDEQLLAEAKALTAPFDVPEEEEPVEEDEIDRFFMEQTQVFTAYNTDNTEVAPEDLSQAVLEDAPSHTSPLVGICCGLATAVLIMILYLVLRYGGFV